MSRATSAFPAVTLAAALALAIGVGGEAFTALVHVENALLAERDLADDIRSYVNKEEERLRMLEILAKDFEHQSSDISRADLERRLANPVSAYATIRDLHDGAQEVERLLNLAVDHSKDFYVKSVITSDLLPDGRDMNGAAAALLRLQDTYQIPTHKIAEGQLVRDLAAASLANGSVLKMIDCLDIGKAAYDGSDFYHAALWFQFALDKMITEPGADTSRRLEVMDYLAFALWKQGNVKRALLLTEEILASRPNDTRVLANKDYYQKELGEEATSSDVPPLTLSRDLPRGWSEDEFMEYERLCRGESSQVRPGASLRLKCRYATGNGNPFLTLAPVKEEELYDNPRIVLYHQLLSDSEISTIKNISIPKLHRSGIFSSSGEASVTDDYRTSKSSWLDDEDHPTVATISKRISAVTGLSLATAEQLQVLNYGIGGHHEPHVDFTREETPNAFALSHGDRIATVLSYLSDVPSGGATVFPRIGASVWPSKGAAVLWYNLWRDGDGDERTMHAACPVLYGYKWVANKWFHERGNEFSRPCKLSALG